MLAFRIRTWGVLLNLFLLSLVGQARVSPTEKAQFQRRLRVMGSGHRFWDAPPDSLRRVLAGQHVDSLRLQTLEHLFFVLLEPSPAENREALLLATKLHYPERIPLRLVVAADELMQAKPVNQQAVLDTLRAAQQQFDALGTTPTFPVLYALRGVYNTLNQQEAKRAYFQQLLTYYQQHGPSANVAMCYGALGSYYDTRGDYNQAINYRLRAAELFRSFFWLWYYSELSNIGEEYNRWDKSTRALDYMHRVAAWSGLNTVAYQLTNQSLAKLYLRQGRSQLALAYTTRSLRPRTPGEVIDPTIRAFGLLLQSAALLRLGRTSEVRPLLLRTQQIADSLHLPLHADYGNFELLATWARYYAANHDDARAEAVWQAAYRQACQEALTPLRLAYLRELARFYQQRAQPAHAAPYALAALALADTLSTAQTATHVAQYEVTQAERTQNARLTHLRQQQNQAATQAQHQRRVLVYVSGGVVGLLGLAGVLYAAFRRAQRLARLVTTQRDQLDRSLTELRTTQAQLIQKEKMASLGELTAGIAHEMQNPLNFVNNFSEVSTELVGELRQELTEGDLAEAHALTNDLEQNLRRIHQHGQRASGIVRGMLEHSRTSSGKRQPTNLNQLADEYLRLAYQGLRTKDQAFNAKLQTDLAPDLALVDAVPGDLGRVLLNLFTNAFYAVQQHQPQTARAYVPTVSVRTRQVGQQVELQVQDNGTGMSPEVQAKVFQPFFTTKPPGEGTGLGLSLSYDIITKGHGGLLTVESQPGLGSTFCVRLPGWHKAPPGAAESLS